MTGLNIIYPDGKTTSKCWQVFEPLMHGWPNSTVSTELILDDRPMCIWGLGLNNKDWALRCIREGKKWLFADMPYFNRWMGEHTAERCHWRLIPNDIHVTKVRDYPSDRAHVLGLTLAEWRKKGQHILIAPSSITVNRFVIDSKLDETNWIDSTVAEIKKYTDRPIRLRKKPRNGKLSGPMVETVPLEYDLTNCWAVVTSCSIVGVQAAMAGIPVFGHPRGPSAPIANINLSDIENPAMPDRRLWLNTLTYSQFTKAEMRSGLAREILHQLL